MSDKEAADNDPSMIFYRNYDPYKVKGGPGQGIYGPDMDKYKSVSDFRKKKKRKKGIKKRRAMLIQMFLSLAENDNNNLTDIYEEQGITPIPYAPAEPAPIGLNGGIIPPSDLEDKPVSNLGFGVLENHMANDGFIEEKPANYSYLLGKQLGDRDRDAGQASDVLSSILALRLPITLSDYSKFCEGYIDGSEMNPAHAAHERNKVHQYLAKRREQDLPIFPHSQKHPQS